MLGTVLALHINIKVLYDYGFNQLAFGFRAD